MTEFAIIKNGDIVNVVTCDSADTAMRARGAIEPPYEVRRLDDVPLVVKQRYVYWDRRP